MKEIKLTMGRVALIDDEDYEKVSQYKWWTLKISNRSNDLCYAYTQKWINKKKVTILMHHIIMGRPEKGTMIDHKDTCGLNNQKSNLRFCTNSQNGANSNLRKDSTTMYKGVTKRKDFNKYESQIMLNQKYITIGFYNTKIEAALAYNEKAKELFGEFARLNII